jgi:hypothetical protein
LASLKQGQVIRANYETILNTPPFIPKYYQ